jgi:organic radical activating enzyme
VTIIRGTTDRRALFVKVVITADTLEEELARAFAIVAEVDPNIEVILQPVTEAVSVSGQKMRAPEPQQALRWQAMALKRLAYVRVIPQTHRLMGQL